MCKAHNAEAMRYWSQEGYTPKWKESFTVEGGTIHSCIQSQCAVTSATVKLVSPAFEEIDNLEAAFCVQSTSDHPFLNTTRNFTGSIRARNHVQTVESSQNLVPALQGIALTHMSNGAMYTTKYLWHGRVMGGDQCQNVELFLGR